MRSPILKGTLAVCAPYSCWTLQLALVSVSAVDLQDLRIRAETLEAQAEIARNAGYERGAAHLLRADRNGWIELMMDGEIMWVGGVSP